MATIKERADMIRKALETARDIAYQLNAELPQERSNLRKKTRSIGFSARNQLESLEILEPIWESLLTKEAPEPAPEPETKPTRRPDRSSAV